jgi:hypothetical protein
MMRKRYEMVCKTVRIYDASQLKNDVPLKIFTPVGKLILLLLVVLITLAWTLAAIDIRGTTASGRLP